MDWIGVRARPFDPPSGVSQAIHRGGKKEELLLAPEALHGLYQRLSIVRRELEHLLTLFGTIPSGRTARCQTGRASCRIWRTAFLS